MSMWIRFWKIKTSLKDITSNKPLENHFPNHSLVRLYPFVIKLHTVPR